MKKFILIFWILLLCDPILTLAQETTQPTSATIVKDNITYTLKPRSTLNKLEQGFYIKGIKEKVYLVKSGDKYVITDGKNILKVVVKVKK